MKKTNTALLDNSLLSQPVPGQGQERGQGFRQEEAVNLAQPYSAVLERATSNTCMSDDSCGIIVNCGYFSSVFILPILSFSFSI